MRSYRYLHLDVFTDRLFGGNQLAVFLDGRGLPADTMQAIAKEMNFSESAFVLPPDRPDTDIQLRIFTPAEELPMAGHPTLGTAFALARAGVVGPDRSDVVFGLGVGPTPLSLTWRGPDLTFAWLQQLAPAFGAPLPHVAEAAAALRLPRAAVADSGLPLQIVSCGTPFLFVPLTTRSAVDSVTLDGPAYEAFCAASGENHPAMFVFSTEGGSDQATAYSRMFAPSFGIAEDPATGGASGPLGCYLVRHQLVSTERAQRMVSLQGAKMGRPSYIHISIGTSGGEITAVRVGGEAVVAGEGTLYLS
jgi:trans-2,3-dihydro-3-hydroxyanthranilate isomerase